MARFEFDGDKYRQAATHQMEWGMDLLGGLALRGRSKSRQRLAYADSFSFFWTPG